MLILILHCTLLLVQELPKGKWLCSPECKRINWEMQKLIDHGEEKFPDSVLESIKKKHEKCGSESVANVDIRWRVLRGRKVDSSDGTRALLSKAVSIFHVSICFVILEA